MACFAANNAVMYNRRAGISNAAPRFNEMFAVARPLKPDERSGGNPLVPFRHKTGSDQRI